MVEKIFGIASAVAEDAAAAADTALAPPPACGDLPIILASNACCSALNPFASILFTFLYIIYRRIVHKTKVRSTIYSNRILS